MCLDLALIGHDEGGQIFSVWEFIRLLSLLLNHTFFLQKLFQLIWGLMRSNVQYVRSWVEKTFCMQLVSKVVWLVLGTPPHIPGMPELYVGSLFSLTYTLNPSSKHSYQNQPPTLHHALQVIQQGWFRIFQEGTGYQVVTSSETTDQMTKVALVDQHSICTSELQFWKALYL